MSRGIPIFAIAVAGAIAILQSTLLRFVAIGGVQPDLVLVVVIFVANKSGSMTGQLAGLGAGVILDLLGLSPLGFYALIYAAIGGASGTTKGKVFVDPIFIPALLALLALLIKAILGVGLAGLFGLRGVFEAVVSLPYLIEIGYTAVISPILFGLLRLMRPLVPDRRRGQGL